MWATLFFLLHTSLSLAVIVRVLLRPRTEPSVRLVWVMVVQAVPVVGVLAYLLFGEVRMNRAEVQRMADSTKNPPMTVDEVLSRLYRCGLVESVDALRS